MIRRNTKLKLPSLRIAIEFLLIAIFGLLITGCGSVNMADPSLLGGKNFSFFKVGNLNENPAQTLRCELSTSGGVGTAVLNFTGMFMVSGQIEATNEKYVVQSGVVYMSGNSPYLAWVAEFVESSSVRYVGTFNQGEAYNETTREAKGSFTTIRYEGGQQTNQGPFAFSLKNCTN